MARQPNAIELPDAIREQLAAEIVEHGELAAIARACRVTHSCILNVLNGKRRPSLELLKRLADACGYTVEVIQRVNLRRKK